MESQCAQQQPESRITGAAEIPEVMTTEQAAAFLGVSRAHLEGARVRGDPPKFSRLSPRIIRYQKSVLLKYLADREVSSTSAEVPK